MRARLVSVALAALVLAVAACSGTSQATTAPTSAAGATNGAGATAGSGGGGGGTVSDPCTLLTQAEISAVVGQQVSAGTKDVEPNECDWQYPADAVPSIQVQITIEVGNTLADLCGPGDSALGLTVTTVGGVGDGACFAQLAGLGAGTNLTFSKGSGVYTVVAILGPSATADAIEAADKALALDALNHIG
ncbi:MAG: hypothetical protein QOI92_1615 [Chloroflexota bacterium]|jgi:hypothetical protein|nr:hypothetical protein [Chloroflexota bacterium]